VNNVRENTRPGGAIQLDPRNYEAGFNEAIVLSEMGKFDELLKCMTPCCKLRPLDGGLLVQQGQVSATPASSRGRRLLRPRHRTHPAPLACITRASPSATSTKNDEAKKSLRAAPPSVTAGPHRPRRPHRNDLLF